jgi:uncharacterized oxidoreductase
MPLGEFIAEVMEILEADPAATEICVERVKRLRHAEAGGNYDALFRSFNDNRKGAAAAQWKGAPGR